MRVVMQQLHLQQQRKQEILKWLSENSLNMVMVDHDKTKVFPKWKKRQRKKLRRIMELKLSMARKNSPLTLNRNKS